MADKEPETIRTFVAVEIPSEVKAAMKGVQDTLRKSGADVGWVRPEGIHLTLKFLGGVDAETVDKLGAALEAAVKGVKTFSLDVKGIGVFPTPKAPRVVWVGISGEMDALGMLYEKVENVCEGLGFAREQRPFKPHLTLGRVKSPGGRGTLMRLIAESEGVELGVILASSASVMKSELKPGGAAYTEIRRILLAG